MPWIQIRINATAKTADKVSNMLLGRGAQAVTFMDAKDVPVYEPMPGETPLWGETEVMGLFDAEPLTQRSSYRWRAWCASKASASAKSAAK